MGQLLKGLFPPLTPTDETPVSVLTDADKNTAIYIKNQQQERAGDPWEVGFAWNRPRNGQPDGAIENHAKDTHLRIKATREKVRRKGLLGHIGLRKEVTVVKCEAGKGLALPASVGLDKVGGVRDIYTYVGSVEELTEEVRKALEKTI